MPVPNGVDAAAQIIWGPGAIDSEPTPDPNGRRILVWGYEYTTLLFYVRDVGTPAIETLGFIPHMTYRVTGETDITTVTEANQTQFMISNDSSLVGGSNADFAENIDSLENPYMLTTARSGFYQRNGVNSAPLYFRTVINNEGAHIMSLALTSSRFSASLGNEITVYAVRWSSGRSNV